MIIIQKLKLGYQNVPKVATTSLFHWLYIAHEGHLGKSSELSGKKNQLRHFFLWGKGGRTIENKADAVNEVKDFYRFALTRDPIKRFLSMYSNRVFYHRELSRKAEYSGRISDSGLPFDPQPNEFVYRFAEYLKVAKIIMHHARPQMDFLGPDLSVYTHLTDISSIGDVISDIRAFWRREGLMEISERAPAEPGWKQTGGPKLGLNVLTPESFEKLLEYYREDYKKLPTVSLPAIKEEYHKARVAGDAEPIVFAPLLEMGTGGGKKNAVITAPRKSVKVKKEACEWTDLVRINLPDDIDVGKPFVLKGAVVLQGQNRETWRLAVEDGEDVREMVWGLPSPALAEKFPANPNASSSRFKLADVTLEATNPVRIWLEATDKQRYLLAEITAD